MRRSPLLLAISLALLAGCQPGGTRSEIAQEAEAPAAAVDRDGINAIDVASVESTRILANEAVAKASEQKARSRVQRQAMMDMAAPVMSAPPPPAPPSAVGFMAPSASFVAPPLVDRENYASFQDNPLHLVAQEPVSTFSIDVDTGSYSNVRRMLLAGQRPPMDAVRAEEMINYFDYGYPLPSDRSTPFRVDTELAAAPWNADHRLLRIGIQGYRVPAAEIPAANLVFLVDTSGSMQSDDKLPLLKRSFAELVQKLRPADRVSIVVYAGSAGMVLPPTPGDRKDEILAALDRLEAGGSTNGGEGLQLAYATARAAFLPKGVNRVLLATDGDFNVGTVDQRALETLVADQRKTGIALTTLGFGTGNYNDALAERLADLGNGNHAYIDSPNEGRKVLVEEMSSTMLTIAADVKIQLEFNPAQVAEYRLIGYENRALRREDFNNDRVDAGEIGAGHDVTALYELTLVGGKGAAIDPLRYGKPAPLASHESELAWLRLRYKLPGQDRSRLVESPVHAARTAATPSESLRWAAAVAAYADLLRGGQHVGTFGWPQVRQLAAGARGQDPWGHRAEFLQLVDRASVLAGGDPPVAIAP